VESEGKESPVADHSRMMIRMFNEFKEEVKKELKNNIQKQLKNSKNIKRTHTHTKMRRHRKN
jgi:hypothetical protein